MWNEPASAIESELAHGERLLWAGKPPPGVIFRAYDVFMIPFSLVWAGFAVFVSVRTLISNPMLFPALCSLLFILVGFYLVFGRFIIDSTRRRNTFYGVTDQRVIIVSSLLSRRVESLNLRTLSDLSLNERHDGRGTISFGPGHVMSWMSWWHGFPPWSGIGRSASVFELIDNAREVYDLIRQAQQQA